VPQTSELPLPPAYVEAAPAPDLAGVVERFWIGDLTPGSGEVVSLVLPDGNVDLLLGLGEEGCRISLFGPATRPMFVATRRESTYLAVRFRPGCAPRLADAAHADLLDACLPLDRVLGASADELGERLLALPDLHARKAALEALIRRACPRPLAGDICRRAAAVATSSGESLSVADLARQAGAGMRRLERAFRADLGLSPKAFLRLVRLQRAVAGLMAPGADHAGLAQACGFADQAHMVREFRDLTGQTPSMVAVCLRNRTVLDAAPAGAVVHRI
jgi:AraC-like DNA-binding protein